MIKFTNLYPELQKEIIKKCTKCERVVLLFVNRKLHKKAFNFIRHYNGYVGSEELDMLKWICEKKGTLYLYCYNNEDNYGHDHIIEWSNLTLKMYKKEFNPTISRP